jgi:hypothetical protein
LEAWRAHASVAMREAFHDEHIKLFAKKNQTIIMGIRRLKYRNPLQNVEVAMVAVETVSFQQVYCFL